MKKAILVCVVSLLCTGYLWAVPSFTPTIDGVQDAGWGTTPDHSSNTSMDPLNFNLDGGCYVTDDATYLYVGFPTDVDPWNDTKSVHVHVQIDVGNTATGGNYDPWGSWANYSQPYLPDYEIVTQFDTLNPACGWTGFNTWSGSWSQVQLDPSNIGGGGGMFTEVRIPRNFIGGPAQGSTVNISLWLRPDWDKHCACACLPEDATFPSNWGDDPCGGTFDSQFAYTIQTVSTDFDPPGIDHITQVDRGAVEIVFDEPMNQTTLNIVGNYTAYGWICTGIRSVQSTRVTLLSAGFTDGSSYSVEVSASVLDLAGNPMDPTDDSAGWTAPDYTDVLFLCQDQSASHDTIMFKGSFNAYHDYDAAWPSGLNMMYDDGTHGDVAAGDYTHSRAWYLLPHENYAWGVTNEAGDWLLAPGGDIIFTVTTNDTSTTAIVTNGESELSQDVTVTFHVDVQFIGDTVDVMRIAGYFTGWVGQDMSDPDLDQVWDFTRVFARGTPDRAEFKFQRIEHSTTYWEGSPNRVVIIDDSAPTFDAGLMFWEDYLPPIDSVTAYAVTGGTEVRWTGYPRVWYQIFYATEPGDIIGTGIQLPGSPTQNMSIIDSTTTDARRYYQVRTYYP